jgi:hypothetical protein
MFYNLQKSASHAIVRHLQERCPDCSHKGMASESQRNHAETMSHKETHGRIRRTQNCTTKGLRAISHSGRLLARKMRMTIRQTRWSQHRMTTAVSACCLRNARQSNQWRSQNFDPAQVFSVARTTPTKSTRVFHCDSVVMGAKLQRTGFAQSVPCHSKHKMRGCASMPSVPLPALHSSELQLVCNSGCPEISRWIVLLILIEAPRSSQLKQDNLPRSIKS